MKVGDLVRWMHPDEPAIGIVGRIDSNDDTSFIYWSDGDLDWYDNEDLEVL
mgnify:FL=1